MNVWYSISHCYSKPQSPHFKTHSFAAVGCWTRFNVVDQQKKLESFVTQRLEALGWLTGDIELIKIIERDGYKPTDDGYEYYQQALIDGFVCHLHTVQRQVISKIESSLVYSVEQLTDFVKHLKTNGCFTLFADDDDDFLIEALPDEQEFMPLWATKDQAMTDLPDWGNCRLRPLPLAELRTDRFFEYLGHRDLLGGIRVSPQTFVTATPLWLAAEIKKIPKERMKWPVAFT
jgi:hypothetical protein